MTPASRWLPRCRDSSCAWQHRSPCLPLSLALGCIRTLSSQRVAVSGTARCAETACSNSHDQPPEASKRHSGSACRTTHGSTATFRRLTHQPPPSASPPGRGGRRPQVAGHRSSGAIAVVRGPTQVQAAPSAVEATLRLGPQPARAVEMAVAGYAVARRGCRTTVADASWLSESLEGARRWGAAWRSRHAGFEVWTTTGSAAQGAKWDLPRAGRNGR